jgi:hypothetical protein
MTRTPAIDLAASTAAATPTRPSSGASSTRPLGAVVTDTTGRSAAVGSRAGIRGRTEVSALLAGMTASLGWSDHYWLSYQDTCRYNIPGPGGPALCTRVRPPPQVELLSTPRAECQAPRPHPCAGSARRQGTDQILATRQVQLAAQMPIRLAPQQRAGR